MGSPTQGAAAKGSRRCLQEWVEHRAGDLADFIVTASPGLTAFRPKLRWKSPLEQDDHREYRDDFWGALELSVDVRDRIRDFWPAQGPQWDGLAVISSSTGQTGYLLVEAKAHPAETLSTMRACDPGSVTKIRAALHAVKVHMGASAAVDWTVGGYQLANRLAFLYFMNVQLGMPTWLALVNFVEDKRHKPTTLREWREHYEISFGRLGLRSAAPLLDRVIMVFPLAE